MAVLLSTAYAPNKDAPALVDGGVTQRASAASAVQRLNRLGAHYRLSVTMPRRNPSEAMLGFLADLQRGLAEGVVYPFIQPGLVIGDPGNPIVDGADQLGQQISLRGFAAGYTVRKGQFFSLLLGGKRYLYSAAAAVTADNLGKLTLPLNTMLRRAATLNAVCEFAAPKIEGTLSGNTVEWTRERAFTTPPQFVVEEG